MAYTPGPYDQRHWYLQWGGTLPGNEQWSCGLRLRSAPGVTATNDPSLLTSYQGIVSAYHARATTSISARCMLTFCKLNVIDTDGTYVDDTTYEHVYGPAVAGGGNASLTPANQVAVVVSLRTAFARGPAHAGRYYLPLPAVTVDSGGLLTTVVRDGIKASSDTFINELNAVSGNADVAVFSRKAPSPTNRLVTTTKVGRVPDTQRRRRRNLVESY